MDLAKVTHNKKEAKMLSYQTTNEIVNLTFSKEFLSVPELVRLIETLRLKELISTQDDIMNLDEDLKASWWNKNKDRFLIKIE